MFRYILMIFAIGLCGCSSTTLSVVDNYHWSAGAFVVECPYGSWKLTTTLTANGEHHIYFGRREMFGISKREGISSSCYRPTRVPSPPISLTGVFSNVTNWVSRGGPIEVEVLHKDGGSMVYQWKAGTTTGIEKLVSRNAEVYRLQYWCSPTSESGKREKVWRRAVTEAALIEEKATNPRPGVDAGWAVLFAFSRPRPRATQADR